VVTRILASLYKLIFAEATGFLERQQRAHAIHFVSILVWWNGFVENDEAP
jgi:hypothetical protein